MEFIASCQNEARRLGHKLYQTGVPCKRGHIAPRRTSGHRCTECHREQQKAAYERKKHEPACGNVEAPRVVQPQAETRKQWDTSPTCNCPKCAAPVVVPAPEPQLEPQPAEERASGLSDPGTRVSPKVISDCIDRIFGDAPRLGREQSQAA